MLSSSVNKKKVFSADLNNKKIHNFVIHSLKMLIFIKTVQKFIVKVCIIPENNKKKEDSRKYVQNMNNFLRPSVFPTVSFFF